jgi:hypothetical protein
MSTRPTYAAAIVQLTATSYQAYHNPAGSLVAIGAPAATARLAEASAVAAYRTLTAGKSCLIFMWIGREDLH